MCRRKNKGAVTLKEQRRKVTRRGEDRRVYGIKDLHYQLNKPDRRSTERRK